MTYEERLAEVKKAEGLLRLAEQEAIEAYNKGHFISFVKAKRDCLLYRRAIIGIADPSLSGSEVDKDARPVDKRLYKL